MIAGIIPKIFLAILLRTDLVLKRTQCLPGFSEVCIFSNDLWFFKKVLPFLRCCILELRQCVAPMQRLQILEDEDNAMVVCSYFSGCFGFPLVPPHRSCFWRKSIGLFAWPLPALLIFQAKPVHKLQRHKTAQGSAVECLQFHWKPSTCIALMRFAVMKSNWDDFVFLPLNCCNAIQF